MQREERQMRRPVGAVIADRPTDRAGDRRETVAVALEALPVILAHGLDPADDQLVPLLDPFEADAAGERQFLLSRIDNLQQMTLEAGTRELRDRCMRGFERRQEIADQQQLP